ncbi:hypothetical protein Tco_0755830 [Tanacetum coccineum]
MAYDQAIKYAPQCGNLIVESLIFHNNNVMGIFGYPQTAPAYHDICKYLMNCPLAEAFTKSPLVVYQNLLREFWCTVIASHPNPPVDDSEFHLLKEYLIKFLVMNGKKPLTLDFKTFTKSTGLDYAKGKYVSHPSPKEVKAELAKIIDNIILLDRIHVLKNTFLMAWRILFAFVVQVLGGNYSSTKQVNSIQRLFAYCLIIGTKPTKDSKQSHSVSLGHVPNPQDPERNKQLAGIGLPSTQLDEGTRKSQLLPEGKKYNPKDSMGNKQPIDTGLPSTIFYEGTVTTMSLPKGPHGDKDSEGLKPPADMEPLTNPVVDPSGTDAKYQADQTYDNEEVFAAGEEMDEDIPLTNKEAQSPTPNKEQPEPSHAQESDSDSSSPKLKKYDNILPLTERQLWEKHEEAIVSYADLKASIEGYYEENVDHRDQTDKLVQATMNSLDKNSTERDDLLKALNGVTEILKAVQEANFDLSGLKSLVETRKAALNAQNNYLVTCDKSSTSMAWNVRRYEDIPLTNEEAQSPAPNKEQPEPSHAQESDSDSSSPELKKYNNILPLTERQLVKYLRKVSRVLFNTIAEDQWEKHEEAIVSYADLKASIEGYYEENVDHRDQTNKLVQATMNSFDKNSTERADLLKALNGVTKILKAIQEATFDFSSLKSLVETMKSALNAQNNHLVTCDKSSTSMAWNVGPRLTKIKHTQALMQADLSSLKSDTSEIKSMMTNIFQAFKGENDDMQIKEDKARKEQEPKRPTKAVPISAFRPLIRHNPGLERMRTTSTINLTNTVLKIPNSNEIELIGSSRPQPTKIPTPEAQLIITIISILWPKSSQAIKRTDKRKKISTDDVEPLEKLVPVSKVVLEDFDEPVRVPYMINGKMYYLTNDKINAYMKKEDHIKKAAKEAKMFEMTETEVIKVV